MSLDMLSAKGVFNPSHIRHKYLFQANPLNKFTVSNKQGKYETILRGGGGGEEMRGKVN